MAPNRRLALHRAALAALALRAGEHPGVARLAHHAEAAGDSEGVLRWAPAAAEQVARSRAHREAAAQYARALRFADGLRDQKRSQLLPRRADECWMTDQFDAAIEAQEQLLACRRGFGDDRGEGDALRTLSRLLFFVGPTIVRCAVRQRRFDLATTYLDPGLEYCGERGLDTWRLYLLAARARLELYTGRWDEAAGSAAEVLRDSRSAPFPRAASMTVLGLVRARRGDPEQAAPLTEEQARATPTGELDRIGAAAEPYALSIAGEWRTAAERWSVLGCPYESALALANGDDEGALRDAIDALMSLGARPAGAIVMRRLRERGVRGLPRGPRCSWRRMAGINMCGCKT